MSLSSLELCLVDALEEAQSHAAHLGQQLEAIRGGRQPSLAEAESWVSAAKQHHRDSIASWNAFLVGKDGLEKGSSLTSALDSAKYISLPAELLVSKRPLPPTPRDLPSSPSGRPASALQAAEEEYKDVRNHLKQAMQFNPLSEEMQVTVSRRMHAVPALGTVPLPKTSGTTGASHLSGTASQAAREIMTSHIESAASRTSNNQNRVVPTMAGNQGGASAAPPWQAELRARQQQRSAQGDAGEAPARGPTSEAARGSMPAAASINSELEAILARRRNSAPQS